MKMSVKIYVQSNNADILLYLMPDNFIYSRFITIILTLLQVCPVVYSKNKIEIHKNSLILSRR